MSAEYYYEQIVVKLDENYIVLTKFEEPYIYYFKLKV